MVYHTPGEHGNHCSTDVILNMQSNLVLKLRKKKKVKNILFGESFKLTCILKFEQYYFYLHITI